MFSEKQLGGCSYYEPSRDRPSSACREQNTALLLHRVPCASRKATHLDTKADHTPPSVFNADLSLSLSRSGATDAEMVLFRARVYLVDISTRGLLESNSCDKAGQLIC